ncbi:MAG: hemerythrin domain-containing protein [Myxococcaceae bacterium]
MNALDLLKKQHRDVNNLFKQLKKASEDSKEDVFIEIADKIATHSILEERIFYPAVYVEDTEDDLQRAVEEHLQVKRLLADMLDMDVNDSHFYAKCEVLEEDFNHHVTEEENDLFKRVAQEFEHEALMMLGREMATLNEMLQETDAYEEIPKETAEAPRLEEFKEP